LHVCKRVNAIKHAFKGLPLSFIAICLLLVSCVRGYFGPGLKIQV